MGSRSTPMAVGARRPEARSPHRCSASATASQNPGESTSQYCCWTTSQKEEVRCLHLTSAFHMSIIRCRISRSTFSFRILAARESGSFTLPTSQARKGMEWGLSSNPQNPLLQRHLNSTSFDADFSKCVLLTTFSLYFSVYRT